MANEFFINELDGNVALSQTKKNGCKVSLSKEETEVVKALIGSQAFKSILEKCAMAGYILMAQKTQSPRRD